VLKSDIRGKVLEITVSVGTRTEEFGPGVSSQTAEDALTGGTVIANKVGLGYINEQFARAVLYKAYMRKIRVYFLRQNTSTRRRFLKISLMFILKCFA